ncbi:MAG: hypothetical protein ISQ15_05665 [Ilumatobacteraceae bacterium]|nr:hypothetical protein [Ilumatobacteraceae bacterium]
MASWIIAAVIVGALVIAIGINLRRRRDTVASFQRQIDALSPEARRGVTKRIRELDPDDDAPDHPGGDVDEASEDDQHGS